MKKMLSISLALLVCGLGCSWFFPEREVVVNNPYVSLSDSPIEQNWVIMGNPEGWSWSDGVIRSEGGKGGNWIRSRQVFGDFSLRLEYRVAPGGNSGVFLRCTEEGSPWVTGYECQISNEQPPRDLRHCTGSLYDLVPAFSRPDESPNVWHQYEIVCKGTRIVVFVDGIQTVDVDQRDVEAIAGKSLRGFIGLQDSHTAEGMWVEFRNVEIRTL